MYATHVHLAYTRMCVLQVQSEHKDERYHETLDNLLNAISPAYVQRRQKLLFAKLEDVAKERSWNEQDEKQGAAFKD